MTLCIDKITQYLNSKPKHFVLVNKIGNGLILRPVTVGYPEMHLLVRPHNFSFIQVSWVISLSLTPLQALQRANIYSQMLQLTSKYNITLLQDDYQRLGISVSFRCFGKMTTSELEDELANTVERLTYFWHSQGQSIIQVYQANGLQMSTAK